PRPAEESRTEDQALANEIGCGGRVGVRIGGEETSSAAFEVDVRSVTALPRVGLADVEPELAPRFDGGSERRHCGQRISDAIDDLLGGDATGLSLAGRTLGFGGLGRSLGDGLLRILLGSFVGLFGFFLGLALSRSEKRKLHPEENRPPFASTYRTNATN